MNWTRALVGGGAAVALSALLAYGMTRDPREIPSPLPGKPAPAFELKTLNGGETVRLADLTGQIAVINFWASWCIPCRDEHPVLNQAAALYEPYGVRFLGVLYRDTPANANAFLQELGVPPYPTLLDPNTVTAVDYGLYGVPETFFIGRDGRVVYKHVGPVTPESIRRVLEPLLGDSAQARP
jgi:cytochrome c biogenesis protein CcmG/thiol:disulfide interchange protein DsbE